MKQGAIGTQEKVEKLIINNVLAAIYFPVDLEELLEPEQYPRAEVVGVENAAAAIAGMIEAERAVDLAKMAGMIEALGAVEHVDSGYGLMQCPWCNRVALEEGENNPENHEADCLRQQALSSAPRMAWQGTVQLGRVPGGIRIFVPEETQAQGLFDLEFERPYRALILADGLPKAEQGQDSEQENNGHREVI